MFGGDLKYTVDRRKDHGEGREDSPSSHARPVAGPGLSQDPAT